MPPPPAPIASAALFSPESLSAAGLTADRLNLPSLQSKMKADPSSYEPELHLLIRHFESSLDLFRHQSALNPSSDPVVAKNLGDLAMLLAHLAPFYPDKLADLPGQISDLLGSDGRALPSSLRLSLVQALILLVNRKIVDLEETLELFMNLQLLDDRTVRKLAFSHVVHSIKRMNQKHKDETRNRKLQNILFTILQGEEETRAKRALTILCELHRRRVWFDERTANSICNACFHPSARIKVGALSFLLGYEQIGENEDSDESESEDETAQPAKVILSKEDVYKAKHKGTVASKKKKKAKLQRVIRSMKRHQRIASEQSGSNYYSPLSYLKDPQGFAEKLFSLNSNPKETEPFQTKTVRMRVICRTVGLHRLVLVDLYDHLMRYCQPHQLDVTTWLASAVQACHDMVPPDVVEPMFKCIVNNFVHDGSRPEAITLGLNVIREICLRMPLLMNEDLLQDLVLYRKTHEKSVSIAARSLMTLFREICPSLLVKKDRGRPMDPKARPKAFGESIVSSTVPGLDLLHQPHTSSSSSSDDDDDGMDDDDHDDDDGSDDVATMPSEEEDAEGEEGEQDSDDELLDDDDDDDDMDDDGDDDDDDEEEEEERVGLDEKKEERKREKRKREEESCMGEKKINAADASLRALKRLAAAKEQVSVDEDDEPDPILSNEDFQRIKELKAKKEAKTAMAQHGLGNIPSSDQLSLKRVDPAKLEAHIKRKLSKEERLEMVRAGREDRGKYQARTAIKQKKTGGLSNRQKEHSKKMPLAARRAKAVRSRQDRKNKQKRSRNQFKGRKAWK